MNYLIVSPYCFCSGDFLFIFVRVCFFLISLIIQLHHIKENAGVHPIKLSPRQVQHRHGDIVIVCPHAPALVVVSLFIYSITYCPIELLDRVDTRV